MKNTHEKTFLNMQNVPSRKDFKTVPDVPGLSIPYYSLHLVRRLHIEQLKGSYLKVW